MVIEYPWTSKYFTTYSIGVTTHMMMVDDIGILKSVILKRIISWKG